MSPRADRRGASLLGCVVWLVLFIAAVYYGFHIGGIYWRYYELLDDMRQQARLAGQLSDDDIRAHLAAQADSILGHAPSFSVYRGGRGVTIRTEYQETVDLPLLKHTFVLRPHAEEPL